MILYRIHKIILNNLKIKYLKLIQNHKKILIQNHKKILMFSQELYLIRKLK